MDSNPKHTAKTIQDFLKAKKRDIIQLPSLPLLQPPSAWGRKHLVTSMSFRLEGFIIKNNQIYFLFITIITFEAFEKLVKIPFFFL